MKHRRQAEADGETRRGGTWEGLKISKYLLRFVSEQARKGMKREVDVGLWLLELKMQTSPILAVCKSNCQWQMRAILIYS